MPDIKIPWSKQPVACADCGYLCWRQQREIFVGEQTLAADMKLPEYTYVEELHEVRPSMRSGDKEPSWEYIMEYLSCFKHAADFRAEIDATAPRVRRGGSDVEAVDYGAGFRAVLAKKRDCPFFYRYRPGYDASLHRDLEERERRDTAARVWNLAFTVVGGVLVLVGAVIVALLT